MWKRHLESSSLLSANSLALLIRRAALPSGEWRPNTRLKDNFHDVLRSNTSQEHLNPQPLTQSLPDNLVWANKAKLTETDTYLCISVAGFEKKLPRRHSSTSAQTARDTLRRLRDLLMYVATKLTPMLPKEAEIVEKRAPTPVLMHYGIWKKEKLDETPSMTALAGILTRIGCPTEHRRSSWRHNEVGVLLQFDGMGIYHVEKVFWYMVIDRPMSINRFVTAPKLSGNLLKSAEACSDRCTPGLPDRTG